MDIVSKIERKNGTTVTFGSDTYHFKPKQEGGKHIAAVENETHIKRLLSIPEGFEPLDPDEARDLIGAEAALENNIEPEGNADKDHGDDERTPEQKLEDNIEPTGTDENTGTDEGTAPEGGDDLDGLDDAAMRVAYEDQFDKKPQANMKPETMAKRIREARAAK
jgi:hypothetical protein